MSCIKRETRYFHVVVVKSQQRNVQESVMHVQSCCFTYPALFPLRFGLPSTYIRRVKTVTENASFQKRSPVGISENAVLLYSCGWMKHENMSSFENDNVTMLVTSKCTCFHHSWSRFQSLYRFSVDGQNYSNKNGYVWTRILFSPFSNKHEYVWTGPHHQELNRGLPRVPMAFSRVLVAPFPSGSHFYHDVTRERDMITHQRRHV